MVVMVNPAEPSGPTNWSIISVYLATFWDCCHFGAFHILCTIMKEVYLLLTYLKPLSVLPVHQCNSFKHLMSCVAGTLLFIGIVV